MNFDPTLLALGALLLSFISAAIVYFIYNRKLILLQHAKTELEKELALKQQSLENHQANQQQVQAALTETFNGLSHKALQQNSDTFLKLAQENFKQLQARVDKEFGEKEKAVENLVKPIRDALEKTEKQIHSIEKERKEAYGALSQHLKFMSEAQQALQGETRNLVNALSRPSVRGQWGELTLRRLVELAGMVKHCDFYEQTHTQGEDGAVRPDMLVRMPGERDIVVDAKTPLDAYLRASESENEQERQGFLLRHAKNLKDRVRELSSKSYWSQFSTSPDFVVMFIPGDQFLSSALDKDPNLLEFAIQQKVMLATPISLVALLRAVAYGWRQESLASNAEHIREIGSELYGRLATFAEHLNKLGKSLSGSVQHYNKAVGSFDTRILSSARKFREMGIENNKVAESVEQVEHTTKTLSLMEETEASANQNKNNKLTEPVT